MNEISSEYCLKELSQSTMRPTSRCFLEPRWWSTMVDHHRGSRKQRLVGRIVDCDNSFRQYSELISFIAYNQNRTSPELFSRFDTLLEKLPGNPNSRGTQCENNRRWT